MTRQNVTCRPWCRGCPRRWPDAASFAVAAPPRCCLSQCPAPRMQPNRICWKPAQLIADGSLPAATRAANEYVAGSMPRSGIPVMPRCPAALAENFIDKTPPEGRRQGPEGAILASRAFRRGGAGFTL